MKKRIAGIFFALVCLTFLFPVYAQESAAFSIVRKHLLAGESDTSMLSNSEISEMISELAQNGYVDCYNKTRHPVNEKEV